MKIFRGILGGGVIFLKFIDVFFSQGLPSFRETVYTPRVGRESEEEEDSEDDLRPHERIETAN